MRIVLASASPRRRDLLAKLGLEVVVRPADIDESVHLGEDPIAYVRRLSIEKATAVDGRDALVIAADTTVEVDGIILGKPGNDAEAKSMLHSLSGRTHQVHTGVTVIAGARSATDVVTTDVIFVPLAATDIDWYVATGEPFDKAGAYAIQGAGGAFVERVDGSVSNVIGLPLATVIGLAGALGVNLLKRQTNSTV